MDKLKCYQVGEYDIVAAYSTTQAKAILIEETGCDMDDIDEVFELSAEFLSKPTVNEDGDLDESWGESFSRCTEPCYVGGWE